MGDMQAPSDAELLAEWTARRSEAAFARLVERYVALVHSAARRQVSDPHLAEEITQAVFILLARKAGSLGRQTVLAGWLCRTAHFAARDALKAERRRLHHEQQAAQMNPPDTASDANWQQVAPLLDEAVAQLRDTDRNAIVLRYYEQRPLEEVGAALGIGADAAQKRVTRALEKLRGIFAKRGVTLTGAAIACAVSANAVQTVPVGLAAKISAAALVAGATLTATTTVVMTALHKTIIGATLAAAVATGIYEARQASNARTEVRALKEQQATVVEQIQQLQRERDNAVSQLAAQHEDNERLKRNTAELLKLRGEVTQLRADSQELLRMKITHPNQATEAMAREWAAKVNMLKEYVQRNPAVGIPECQFITERDWLNSIDPSASYWPLKTDEHYRQAVDILRDQAQLHFQGLISTALRAYSKELKRPFPTELTELRPFLESGVADVVVQQYEMVLASNLPPHAPLAGSPVDGDWMIARKSAARERGQRMVIFPLKRSGWTSYEMSFY